MCALAAASGCQTSKTPAPTDTVIQALTSTADNLRTGWYPNQPGLDPVIVGGPSFGRIWNTTLPLTLGEQVLAQPLVKGTTVFVATESNDLYALDSQTGAVKASRVLGTPFRATDIGCGDLVPSVGVTGTPVVDDTTNTAYFFSKTYLGNPAITDPTNVGWFLHGVDVDTLVERSGFPVAIAGNAANDPSRAFKPFVELQRTALLLMNGVIFGGFGSHCDVQDWRGWIVGVGTDGRLKTMFTTMVGAINGAGLWGSGGGLVSDGPGSIFFTTGNANGTVDDSPQATPSSQLDESAVHVQVQSDGTLLPVDFFSPYNRKMLDSIDADFGAGGPVGLPSAYFGTAATPNLMIAGGKSGILYVLDRDHLGGLKQGPAGADSVVSSVTTRSGGLWSRVAVWPGDGGYIFAVPNQDKLQAFKYGLSAAGAPTFSLAGSSSTVFGYTSGSPIVTSNADQSGTAIVWTTYSTDAFGSGTLEAYGAVPDGTGALTLLYQDSYGKHAKFSVPGVGDGRLFVGSADGHVLAYGSPVNASLTVAALTFGTVTVGATATLNAVLTAQQAVTVTSLATTSAAFSVGTPSAHLPATLAAGATLVVPVTFAPSAASGFAAALNVTTSVGVVAGSLRGVGQPAGPSLKLSPSVLSFGGLPRGTSSSMNLTLSNVGAQALTWNSFTTPASPFHVTGLPGVGATLAAGASLIVSVTFSPTTNGTFAGTFAVGSNGGNVSAMMSGAAGDPPALSITPSSLAFQGVTGQVVSQSFTVANTGGTPLTITKSKPPALGLFTAQTALDEGTSIPAGQSRVEIISFAAPGPGTFSDQWIITGNDSSGVHSVSLTGAGAGGTAGSSGAGGHSGSGGAAGAAGTMGAPAVPALEAPFVVALAALLTGAGLSMGARASRKTRSRRP